MTYKFYVDILRSCMKLIITMIVIALTSLHVTELTILRTKIIFWIFIIISIFIYFNDLLQNCKDAGYIK